MTSDLFQTTQPVAIPFKNFRDEEIVDFFANEKRTFQPNLTAPNESGRSRLVGAPHFATEHKGNAAFHVSFRLNDLPQEHDEPRCGVIREKKVGTIPTIPIPSDILDANPKILAATLKEEVTKRKRIKKIEPAFSKPVLPIAAAKVEEQLSEQIQETDVQLSRLIHNWHKLSTELKEKISALLDVTEKTISEV
jgi:hypothetical protein